nr:molybdopterin molybdotransferase MoeA [Ktedonobacterales bacterium]
AALGLTELPCIRRPRVALISTGDELVQPGNPLPPGHIYDSNTLMLATHLHRMGAEVACKFTASDHVGTVRDCIGQALQHGVDLIITSGGISTGDFDLVKDALSLDGTIDFWQILMRPGKPLAFGAIGTTPLIGLPGNPIAAFVGCALFVRAHLAQLQGLDPEPPLVEAFCAEPIRNGSHKRHFLRGTHTLQDGQLHVRLAGGQMPNQFATLAHSTCLIVAHESREHYAIGDRISILPLDALGAL